MNLSLLLGVSSSTAGSAIGPAGHTDAANTATIDGVDASTLAGAFRRLVDELMSGQRADDASPGKTPAASEADDLTTTFEASQDGTEAEFENAPQAPQAQMWLVELEIINRTAGLQTDLPLLAVVPQKDPHTDEQTPDVPAKSGDATESLGTLIGMTPITQPEAPMAPTVPATPQAMATTPANPPTSFAADAPADLTAESAARSAPRSGVDDAPRDAPRLPRVNTPRPALRQADSDNESVPGSGFQAPGSGSGFAVQGSGSESNGRSSDVPGSSVQGSRVATPEGATRNGASRGAESRNAELWLAAPQNPEPRALNPNPEPGTRNSESLRSFLTSQPGTEFAAEPVKTDRSNRSTAKLDTPPGQAAIDARAGLIAAAIHTTSSGDAPDRGRRYETHATIARPSMADLEALGAVTLMASAHDLLAGRPASVTTPSIVLPPGSPGTSSLPEETTNQIVQSIRLHVMRGGGEATIRLEPKHFGEMSITVRVEQGHVTARLQAESPIVREYLHAHQGMLRESLADQQLTLGKFEIAEPPAESRGERRPSEERGFQGERQPQRRRQPAADTPFEPFEVVA